MKTPSDLYYTKNDEWLKVKDGIGTMGITDYAQDQLSDVVFVEIVAFEGDELEKGDTCAVVESVKAAADVYMPVGGTITDINENLVDTPEVVNEDPFGDAWLVKFEISDESELDDLLDAEAYKNLDRDH